jgi:hypothetical protein
MLGGMLGGIRRGGRKILGLGCQWFQQGGFQWFQGFWASRRSSSRAGGSRSGFRASAEGSRCGSKAVDGRTSSEEATASPDLDHGQSPIPKLGKMRGWLPAALRLQLCLTLSAPRMIANPNCWSQLKKT